MNSACEQGSFALNVAPFLRGAPASGREQMAECHGWRHDTAGLWKLWATGVFCLGERRRL